ncbi:MAG: glycosyltransferase, partial [Acidobacteria bacterium]|nr:glycosyltransferase [Acidobacteriota bacterium]
MRICLVGGIYGKSAELRRVFQMTPETILEQGLRSRGHEVTTAGHRQSPDWMRFDVIHVHHLGLGALRAACARSEAAFVFTTHDPEAICGLPVTRGRRLAMRWVMSKADAVVALSAAEARFQQRTYLLAGARQAVISNGIDAETYTYVRKNEAGRNGAWRLLYVGQLIEMKRVDVLLRALSRLPESVEADLVYHNSALEQRLRELAVNLGLERRVRFAGGKNPAELRDMYQRADLLVHPSAGEALPSVLTEAMLCGTPLVATAIAGVPEQLAGYGVLVRPGCDEDLAVAIRQVLEHYDEYAAKSEPASRYARQRFSIEQMVSRHLELYQGLAAERKPRRRHGFLGAPARWGVEIL